jgi:hypothetical protein
MPDRELPEELRARLSAELAAGAPLRAPLASQARYSSAAAAAVPQRHLRGRVLAVGAAALVVLVGATFAGPTPPRAWLVTTVGNIAGDRGAPSPSPANETGPATSPNAASHRSPSSTSAPEQRESPVPGESPGAHQSPEPVGSPSGADSSGGDGYESSPTASPSRLASGDGH